MTDEDRHDRGAAQGAGLRHRPVRQEPPRRPERHAADQSRLRRVLRQPVPPQCRGRAGDVQLSHGKGLPEFQEDVRAARRHPLLGHRQGRQDGDAALGQGRQAEDRGHRPLTTKRMETCDDEFVAAATDFIKKQNEPASRGSSGSTPPTCTCSRTRRSESLGQAGRWQSPYHDTMIDHDKNVGQMLDLLDELGIADDTFVMYSTDNGPHRNCWPDGGMTPFRSEKNTNWEGAFRVPLLVRWPGQIKAGSVANGIVQHHDWLPTFLAMPPVRPTSWRSSRRAIKAIGRTYKNHIDGFNLLPYLTGRGEGEPAQLLLLLQRRRRRAWVCASTTGRSSSWSSGCHGTMEVWAEPFVKLRLPKIFNLRTDPYELRRHHVEHLLRLDAPQRLLHLRGSVRCGEVRRDLQGVPGDPEAEQLHHRRRDGQDVGAASGGGLKRTGKDMTLGAGRHLPDGIGRALPGGTRRPIRCSVGWILDRRTSR